MKKKLLPYSFINNLNRENDHSLFKPNFYQLFRFTIDKHYNSHRNASDNFNNNVFIDTSNYIAVKKNDVILIDISTLVATTNNSHLANTCFRRDFILGAKMNMFDCNNDYKKKTFLNIENNVLASFNTIIRKNLTMGNNIIKKVICIIYKNLSSRFIIINSPKPILNY